MDLLTLANASCGALSIFACLSYIDGARSRQIWAAFVLLMAAAFHAGHVGSSPRSYDRALDRLAC